MIENPFTPVFGGKPSFFFGRSGILDRFDIAMLNHGSEDRALFITGTRGSGKTALLEQLSRRAHERGWLVVDLGPENTTHTLLHRLVGFDEQTKTVGPQVGINVLGLGGSLGGLSSSKTTHLDASDLDMALIETCENQADGVFVTIDEVQKLPLSEISSISNAFQMASRRGCEVMLAIAGLPYAYEAIIHHEGCTYMRRASHEELGLMTRGEITRAFEVGFARGGDLEIGRAALEELVDASYGHPYLVQLLGYHLVELVRARGADLFIAGRQDVAEAVRLGVAAYQQRALRPMVSELTATERSYLTAMAESLDDERIASTAQVARKMGKTTAEASYVRDRLLKLGIVSTPRRGKLRFAVPYLATYLTLDDAPDRNEQLLSEWRV